MLNISCRLAYQYLVIFLAINVFKNEK